MMESIVRSRMKTNLKTQTARILASMGLDLSEAIRLFFTEIVITKEIPFPIRSPNAASRRALKEVKSGKLKGYDDPQAFYKAVGLK